MDEDDDSGATIAINIAICFGIVATVVCFCIVSAVLLALLAGSIVGTVYIGGAFVILPIMIGLIFFIFANVYGMVCAQFWSVVVIATCTGDPFGGDE